MPLCFVGYFNKAQKVTFPGTSALDAAPANLVRNQVPQHWRTSICLAVPAFVGNNNAPRRVKNQVVCRKLKDFLIPHGLFWSKRCSVTCCKSVCKLVKKRAMFKRPELVRVFCDAVWISEWRWLGRRRWFWCIRLVPPAQIGGLVSVRTPGN